MELTPEQITEGMIFYGIKSTGDFPRFSKFQATKITGKQIKAKDVRHLGFGSGYEHTLRVAEWKCFSDFSSARESWIATVLDADIKMAEGRLIAAQKRKEQILAADDL